MDQALRRAERSAAISLAPAPPALSGVEGPDSSSADLVEPVVELDGYVAEVSVDARDVDDRHVDDRQPEPPAVSDSTVSDSAVSDSAVSDSAVSDSAVSDSTVSDSEVEAMHAIGRALTGLPDADARARVLRWATESFVERGLQPACCERAAASGRLSANSMIHSFVADFQQLVRDWHGCFDHPDGEPDARSAPVGSFNRGDR